mgnify:CR=1 FL=1
MKLKLTLSFLGLCLVLVFACEPPPPPKLINTAVEEIPKTIVHKYTNTRSDIIPVVQPTIDSDGNLSTDISFQSVEVTDYYIKALDGDVLRVSHRVYNRVQVGSVYTTHKWSTIR